MPAASFPVPENTLLPVANRTQSFWLSERDPILDKARTTANMPQTADVVVVGGGLTGVLTAYNILKKAPPGLPPSVVLVEASDFCNGATARNGGHCKPMTYFGYEQDRALRGPAAANALLEFEEAQLAQYIALVEAESDIDCDLHVTRACDVFFDAKEAESARRSFLLRKEDHPRAVEAGDVREITDRAELEKVSGMKGGYWGATYPAGHLWPYKLACGLAHAALKCGLNLQTNTPVLSITKNSSSPLPWTVTTERGTVSASTVVIATNAYTAGILPDFKDKIVPVRGTACSITPSRSHLPGGLPGKLTYSYGLRFGAGQSDYMIPRQGRGRIPGRGDQSYILGGAKGLFQHTPELWYNTIRDDEQFAGAREYFEDYASKHFVGWDASSGSLDFLWTGILGYSSDLLPYIGEHPTKEGLFVLAGFTGHGMPRIPACAEAVASLVSSRLTSADRRTPPSAVATFRMAIPEPYHLTVKRLASKVNLIKTMLGSKAADEVGNKAIEEPGDLTTEVAVKAKL